MITATALCAVLLSSTIHAEEKNQTVTKKSVSTTDVLGNKNITIDAAIGFVDSFAIMGDCQEGQKARKEIEAKRDLASNEIQEESKKFEKLNMLANQQQ